MTCNIYLLVALILLLGFGLGRLFQRLGLTQILAYILAGIISGPILSLRAPVQLGSITTTITLAFVGYIVGLSFSFGFLKKAGKKISIILVTEVIVTTIVVWAFIYLLTRDIAFSIILASLAPATAPAGTVAVLRDLKAKGTLTNTTIAIVGLDDAAAIMVYSIGITWVKALLGSKFTIGSTVIHPVAEIFGAIALGGAIGFLMSYLTKTPLSSDHIFTLSVGVAALAWGIAEMIGVSEILTCMVLGMVVINLNPHIGNRSGKLVDNVMTPIFILFFAAIGMEVDFSQFISMAAIVIMYCLGRTVGKLTGCSIGGALSKGEPKIRRYLGIALLNQAGVAVGLAFLAAHELSAYALGGKIITLMATTTAIFQVLSPLGTQYAIKKAGESNL